MIKAKNESKALVEHVSCASRCEFNTRKCSSNQKRIMISVNVREINKTSRMRRLCLESYVFASVASIVTA